MQTCQVAEGGHQLLVKRDIAQSAVLVPVPEAQDLVGHWRAVHDPRARAIPPHITLVLPWLPPDKICRQNLEELDSLVAEEPAFDYTLDRVCWFGDRVLWLAPTPDEPFKRLTSLLASHFGTPPWAGEFNEVVPHLTVGLTGHGIESPLHDAADDLSAKLPLTCRARELDVICGDGSTWGLIHRTVLHEQERSEA